MTINQLKAELKEAFETLEVDDIDDEAIHVLLTEVDDANKVVAYEHFANQRLHAKYADATKTLQRILVWKEDEEGNPIDFDNLETQGAYPEKSLNERVSEELPYGLIFNLANDKPYAVPTDEFWKAYRADKEKVRAEGFRVFKGRSGWMVTRTS